ncbi:MAG TPA: maleylpyruvate isomerase family mycothiol-dependent enzyme [Acidimicrobiales bacterium]|nr:maleylpyruvate isomerase family mycothiol-dependent enzyme [Acidimicrobiales bacterium]
MQLTPRYAGPPLLVLDLPLGDPSVPMVRQRRRLGAMLEGLTPAQWATPSRCEGWSVHDVVAHLEGVNRFWTASVLAGLRGEPTRFLASFDPVVTPALMVEAVRSLDPSEVLARFRDSVEALAAAVDGLGAAGLAAVAEAPPGHVPIAAAVLHALWDGWIHERDIALPLGVGPALDPEEITDALVYVAALGPVFLATAGSTRVGTLLVEATDPDASFVVAAGTTITVRPASGSGDPRDPPDARLAGRAVDLVEALSFRAPFPAEAELPVDDDRWLLGGLAEVFETTAGR